MRFLFSIILIALILSLGLVALMQKDPGYVLFSYGSKTYEMSVWAALFLFGVISIALYASVRIVVHVLAPRGKLNRWLGLRSQRRLNDITRQGLLAFLEGNWDSAQKLLGKSAKNAEYPLLSYLLAARASQALGDAGKSYDFLRLAENYGGDSPVAVGLTQAQLELSAGHLEDCVATLTRLRKAAPKHTEILKMLADVYQRLDDWSGLYTLLPELKKQKVFTEDKYSQLQIRCLQSLLAQAGDGGPEALRGQWSELSSAARKIPQLVAVYARSLLANNAPHEAEKLLRLRLKRDWDDELVDIYGLAPAADGDKQLLLAESWLKQRPNNPVLLRCLARIAFRNGQKEKARDYFLSSLKYQKDPETYIDLARLMEQCGDHKQSTDYYQLALNQNQPANALLPGSEKNHLE